MPTSLLGLPLAPVLLLCGVLAAIAMAERLARQTQIPPRPIGNALLLGLATIFFGERLLLFLAAWRDFLAHPLWMAGLITVRDARLFFMAAAFALAACAAYITRMQIPLARAAAALLPSTLLLLAFAHAANFVAGSEPGRVTTSGWGIVSTDRMAHALYGTPLLVPSFPVAAWLSCGFALLALLGIWATTRPAGTSFLKRGEATGCLLLGAGLLTLMGGQLLLHVPGSPLLLDIVTWPQAAGTLTAIAGMVQLGWSLRH